MADLRRRVRRTLIVALVVALFVGLYFGARSASPHTCATPCDCTRSVDRPCR